MNNNWFLTEQIDEDTFVISEPKHWEETHCYLLCGKERVLLIDTGLGIGNIYDEIRKITDKSIIAVPTHIHWDHIGGLWKLPEFYVHEAEANWIDENFPLPTEFVQRELVKGYTLPDNFDTDSYAVFQGKPARILKENDVIDIGGRIVQIYHTPGHSPGHICIWEKEKGYLFTGDLAYKGTLFANYPSTDPKAYLNSLEKISNLPAKRIFPAHHSLDINPEILIRMRDSLCELDRKGILHHGSGKFSFEDWEILL